ncbi:glycoside hydrolase family 10 protein [Massilia sp. TS11]|uniref:glycoside hydrolase family 10 protein n=1 Tax=Massilia sp. TS11 TaxID=2908003 RepID=UPI001EDC4F8A|nr:family 10 glycosylhydrolase [Massilia sp. TS11]MCG2585159.1 family 10 glycosylhydrolase [Massilia sp. TS11]
MQANQKRRALALAGALALGGLVVGCSTSPTAPSGASPSVPPQGTPDTPPPVPREFRAAWVSTVANIDWPSKPGLSSAQQQAEALAILDKAVALNLNAIVLQVRPSADAIYPSALEPWSEYLSGAQGQAPKPFYDPLAFWVKEAHERGLELHAWFNPYRARHMGAKSPAAREHISNRQPGAVKAYGKYLWMDPGEEAASRHTLEVVLDVVRRYDIDGVHIDDYFYPYPETIGDAPTTDPKNELDFPDAPAYARYRAAGGKLEKADWRRQNVNQLIEALYTGVHREKPWVKFGISPFGIGKPERRPAGISGFSQYDKLYADVELWLEQGWLDYLAPQLYWPIAQSAQAYEVLLDYWLAQNRQGRHVWPGLFTSRIEAPAKAYTSEEILEQVRVTRLRPGAQGHLHFSMAALMQNRGGVADQLRQSRYPVPALVPATPWHARSLPAAPVVSLSNKNGAVRLQASPAEGVARYAVWGRYGDSWRFAVMPANGKVWTLPGQPSLAVVTAIDRHGQASPSVSLPVL